MKQRTATEMAEYQRTRRQNVTPSQISVVTPPKCNTQNVTPSQPCRVPVQSTGLVRLDADLHLDMRRDLGITAWTPDGIFIRPDITIPQVQAIARLIHAKNGNRTPAFRSC